MLRPTVRFFPPYVGFNKCIERFCKVLRTSLDLFNRLIFCVVPNGRSVLVVGFHGDFGSGRHGGQGWGGEEESEYAARGVYDFC